LLEQEPLTVWLVAAAAAIELGGMQNFSSVVEDDADLNKIGPNRNAEFRELPEKRVRSLTNELHVPE
jgi:hypothetical protein